MSSAADAFRQALESNRDFANIIGQADFPSTEFQVVQNWQRRRFRRTYADFAARETDRPACEFFLQELYGGLNFRDRDEDVSRVEPIMSRLLPDSALTALSEALQLQRLSLDLDLQMAKQLQRLETNEIDDALYVQLYRAVGRKPERELQIDLTRKLGHELQWLTRTPLLLGLVKAVRKPAVAAGYGRLQAFLEEGLAAFRELQDPQQFVEAIFQRESGLMREWFGESGPADSQPVTP